MSSCQLDQRQLNTAITHNCILQALINHDRLGLCIEVIVIEEE